MNRNILKNLTQRPGIYKMLDQNKKIIYIGKASNLKKRVSSYFVQGNSSVKTNKLIWDPGLGFAKTNEQNLTLIKIFIHQILLT